MNESIRRLVAAGCVAIAVSAGGSPAAAIDDAAIRGARYLVERQQASGAFFSADARADGVAEVVASLVAGGVAGTPVDRALEYLKAHGSSAASKPAYAGRIVMGIVAAGDNPRRFGGIDYVARIKPDSEGSYDSNLYGHALAALGLEAAGGRVPSAAMQHIREHQCPDGGYAYDPGCASAGNLQHALRSNVDTTALVLCVLVAAGVAPADEARSGARSFLASAMNVERGFGEYAGEATSANSTGLALSAIAAIGESPVATPWRSDGRDPLAALRAMQKASGAFPPNDYATVQAVPGLAAVGYPVRPRTRVASPGKASPGPSDPAKVVAGSTVLPVSAGAQPRVPSPVAAGDASVSAAATPAREGVRAGGRSGVVALALVGLAGAAEGLRRGRRRWVESRVL